MARCTYGPVVVTAPTLSALDDPATVGFDTDPIPISRTRNGTPETDLQVFAADTGTVNSIAGTVTPNAASGAAAVTGPDGYADVLWFAGYPVMPNELPELLGLPDGSVTNAKVATGAAIDLAKTVDSTAGAGRKALTTAQNDKLAQINLSTMAAGQLLQVNSDASGVTPVSLDSLPLVQDGDLPSPLVATIKLAPGAPIPAGLTAQTLIARTGTSTFGVSGVAGTAAASSVTAASGLVLTTTVAIAANQRMVLCIAADGGGSGAATTYTITAPAGSGTLTKANGQIQGTTQQTDIHRALASSTIPSGSTFTIKPDTDRSDMLALLLILDGTDLVSSLDQTAINGGGTASSFSVGPTGTTVASDEVAVAAWCYSPGSATAPTRTFVPSGGWTQAGATLLSTDASPRALAVTYLVLTSTGTVTATAGVTGTGGNTSWSGTLATFKKA